MTALLDTPARVTGRTPRSTSRGGTAGKVAGYTLLIVLSLAVMIPFAWMLSSSLKQNNQVFTVPIQWIPTELRWENYAEIWDRIPLWTYLGNSMILSVSVTALQVLTGSFAAYGFAKVRFPAGTRCSWPTSPRSRCPGRRTWCRSTSSCRSSAWWTRTCR